MYKNKYLKYKNKYLKYHVSSVNQKGSGDYDWINIKRLNNIDDDISDLEKFSIIYHTSEFNYEYIDFLIEKYELRPTTLFNIPCKILCSFNCARGKILLNPDKYFDKLNEEDKVKITYYIYTGHELENISENKIYKYYKCNEYKCYQKTGPYPFKYLFYNEDILYRFMLIFKTYDFSYDYNY